MNNTSSDPSKSLFKCSGYQLAFQWISFFVDNFFQLNLWFWINTWHISNIRIKFIPISSFHLGLTKRLYAELDAGVRWKKWGQLEQTSNCCVKTEEKNWKSHYIFYPLDVRANKYSFMCYCVNCSIRTGVSGNSRLPYKFVGISHELIRQKGIPAHTCISIVGDVRDTGAGVRWLGQLKKLKSHRISPTTCVRDQI